MVQSFSDYFSYHLEQDKNHQDNHIFGIVVRFAEEKMQRKLIQYPIDMADRKDMLPGVLRIKRQMLYITIRDRDKPWWFLRHKLATQAKRINEIVKELYP